MENNEEEEIKPVMKSRTTLLIIIAVLAIVVVAIYLGEGIKRENTMAKYSLEGRIILNQISERKIITLQMWDLNEWVMIHNIHLENYYNLLLEYEDESLTSLVRSEEECLKVLDSYNGENVEIALVNEQIDLCNEIGSNIDTQLQKILKEKIVD